MKKYKLFMICIFLILLTGCYKNCTYIKYYKYIDIAGNEGISDRCYTSKKGGLYCSVDRGRAQVAQYKKIIVKKGCSNE